MRRIFAGYAFLVILSATVALTIALTRHDTTLPDPFPTAQHQAVAIDLYYPAQLPEGFQIDTVSAENIEKNVVVLRATNPEAGTIITLSQQAAPKDFNFNILHNSFEGKTSYKVKLGTVTTGSIDNGKTKIASLVTKDNTWILLNTTEGVSDKDVRFVFGHLSDKR